jgi:hypothetical protein
VARRNSCVKNPRKRSQRNISPESLRIFHTIKLDGPGPASDDLVFLRSDLQDAYGADIKAPLRVFLEETTGRTSSRHRMELTLLDSRIPSSYARPSSEGYKIRDIGRIRAEIENGLDGLQFPRVGLPVRFFQVKPVSEIVENPKALDHRTIALIPDPEHVSTGILRAAHGICLDSMYHKKDKALEGADYTPYLPIGEMSNHPTDVTLQDVIKFVETRLDVSAMLAPPTFESQQRIRAWDN